MRGIKHEGETKRQPRNKKTAISFAVDTKNGVFLATRIHFAEILFLCILRCQWLTIRRLSRYENIFALCKLMFVLLEFDG